MGRSQPYRLDADRVGMPAVDDMYNRNMLNVLLDRAFVGPAGPPRAWPEAGVFVQFVRLVDKALREYDASRADLFQYLDAGESAGASSFLRASDHMDTAVVSAARAERLAASLRSRGYGRSAPPLTALQAKRLRSFRNTLEHADERLLGSPAARRLAVGDPYAVWFGNEVMIVGHDRLRYDELVTDLRKLYKTVEAIRGPSVGPSVTPNNSRTRTISPPLAGGTTYSSYMQEMFRLLSTH